jgi:cobalt/nickel transport system permease protein
LLLTISLALIVSPFASNKPDGLNRVAIDQGFEDTAGDHPLSQSPVAGYGMDVVDDARVSRGLSGLIGVLATFGAALLLFGALRSGRTKPAGHTQER